MSQMHKELEKASDNSRNEPKSEAGKAILQLNKAQGVEQILNLIDLILSLPPLRFSTIGFHPI